MKACIFDLDGTILYTLDSIALAGNRMLGELGFPPRPTDEYRYYCGDGSDNLVRRTVGVSCGLIPETVFDEPDTDWTALTKSLKLDEDLITRGSLINRKYLAENPLFGVRPYDGMEAALKELKAMGLSLAVCTNKPDEAALSVVTGAYGSLFDHVEGQKKGVPVKPDPFTALKTARILGVLPSECLYIGDTWTDIETGRAAGMFTAGVLWGYRPAQELTAHGARHLFSEPGEIPPFVRKCRDFQI